MTHSSTTVADCPKCRRTRSSRAPRGLCPACLLSAALADGPLAAEPAAGLYRGELPCAFAHYELLEELGRGGMGVVFKARDLRLNRWAAVKVLAGGGFASPASLERFRREAEAVAMLDHPNIVPVYEVGEDVGQPFFSMRYLEGGTLAGRIADCPIPADTAARITMKLAQAVHYAHQRGILHRDIKPGNVLLDAHGEPQLTDFGVARLVESDSTLTRTTAILGTPSYMSPEQARGEAQQLTTAVDLYGLGAVFYELLTGKPPFAGATAVETLRQAIEQEVLRPSAIRPGIDPDLETVCLKCLEKEAPRRYPSAEALARELERWLCGKPIEARPVTGLERGVKWARRHPLATALSAVTLAAVLLSVTTLIVSNIRIRAAGAREATLRHEAEQRAAENRRDLVRQHVSAGNRLLEEGNSFASLLRFAEALRLENGGPAAEDLHRRRLGAALRLSPQLTRLWFHDGIANHAEFDPRGDRVVSSSLDRAARIWSTATGNLAVPPLRHLSGVNGAQFSPSGDRVVTVDRERHWRFWDAATGALVSEGAATTAHACDGLDFSPDGRWLAVPESGGIRLVNTGSGALDGPFLASADPAKTVRFNGDGQYLAAIGRSKEIQVWALASPEVSARKLASPETPRALAFSRDGQMLAAASSRTVFVWDVATGALLRAIHPGTDLFDVHFSPDASYLVTSGWDGAARIYEPRAGLRVGDSLRHRIGVRNSTVSRDGSKVATASWDGTARVWEPQTGLPISPILPHGAPVYSARFSSDGKRLVTASQDQTVRVWTVPDPGSSARLSVRHIGAITALAFSPDGRHLLSCGHDSNTKVWSARDGQQEVALLRQSQGVLDCAYSPDAKRIATACADGSARLWDAATGTELVQPMKHRDWIRTIVFSPDGSRVVTASHDGTAQIWDARDGKPAIPPLRHAGRVVSAVFSPDGQRVLTASEDRTAQLWHATTGARIGRAMVHPCEVTAAVFSPDGRRIATACSDGTELARAAQLWDGHTGEPLGAPLSHTDGILCVQFSPDGRFLATGGEDKVAVIWDAATGARLTLSLLHGSYVRRVAFSPDSRLLLTMSEDPFARVWEVATGEPVTPPLLHSANTATGLWSPDGNEVAVGCIDGSVSIWDVSPEAGPVDVLRRTAEVLSAHRLDPKLGAIPLTIGELRQRFEEGGK